MMLGRVRLMGTVLPTVCPPVASTIDLGVNGTEVSTADIGKDHGCQGISPPKAQDMSVLSHKSSNWRGPPLPEVWACLEVTAGRAHPWGNLPAPLPLLGMEFLIYRLILGKGFNTVGALWPPACPVCPWNLRSPQHWGVSSTGTPRSFHRSQRPGQRGGAGPFLVYG